MIETSVKYLLITSSAASIKLHVKAILCAFSEMSTDVPLSCFLSLIFMAKDLIFLVLDIYFF